MADLQHVAGLRDLQASLKELPKVVGRSTLRGAVNAGASVIRGEARANAPVYTGPVSEGHPPPGTLKRSIVQKQIRELSTLLVQTFYVTVRKGKKYRNQGKSGNLSQDAFYATWVEWGSSKMAAVGFMRKAFEAKKEAAVQAIKDYLAKRIPLEAAKLPFWKR
jgi:HK97 gp10 family phage protein